MASTSIGALAQTSAAPTPDAEPEAKRAFELGSKLYAEGAVREALAAFEQSYRLDPRASSLQNVAQCLRDLRNFARAYEAYDELITRFGSTAKADKIDAARQVRDDLARVTGSVRVDIAEAGAQLSIDDAAYGVTPIARPIRLGVGPHTLVLTKPAYRPLRKVIDLKGNDEVVLAEALEREATAEVDPRAKLAVVTTEPTAAIALDGALVGHGSWEGAVTVGPHALSVSMPGLAPVQRRFDAAAGGSIRLEVPLQHVADAHGGEGGGASGSGRRTLGYVALAGGGVGLAVGGITGLLAIGKHGDLADRCPGDVCYGAAAHELAGYHTIGAVSTASFIAGGVLLGAGVVLLVTGRARSPRIPAVSARVGPGFVALRGAF